MLDYVGRYTHRVAITNNRLLAIEDGNVRFRWKDYRNDNAQESMTLTAEEFIRRFLLHALPLGLQRIRYYGLFGNRHRSDKLAQCRRLLNQVPDPSPPATLDTRADYRDRVEALTGLSLHQCPSCRLGHMLTVEQFDRRLTRVPVIDSS